MMLRSILNHIRLVYLFVMQRLMTHLARYLAYHENETLKNRLIVHFFSRFPDASLVEAKEKNPFAYTSFYALFSRHLMPSARPVARNLRHILIPADGILASFGWIEEGQLIQAKGCTYTVAQFLGRKDLPFKQGIYATIYLQPTDYHRIHAPTDGILQYTDHIPGLLYSVGRKQMNSIPGLLTKNERLACYFNTPIGDMSLTFVGATLVGSIETVWGGMTRPPWFNFDVQTTEYKTRPPKIKQGAEVGHFHFGSTVVILINRTDVTFNQMLQNGQQVCYGQLLATLDASS
jgi:phosphatidylserine decarboxylase